MKTSRGATLRRRIGVSLMVASMGVGASIMTLAPAGAQSASDAEPTPLEVEKTAYYITNAGRAVPDTLTSEFPPGVVCVVRPELCPESLEPVTGPIGDGVGEVENLESEPQGTAPPGSLPVSIFAGETRYNAAVKVVLPELAPGQELGRFVLRLGETQPTYHSSSPAFRQAVLAAVASAGAGEPNQEEFQKVLGEDPVESAVIGVEACPTTEAFEAGDGQPEENQPEIDCIFGSNGVRLDDGTWEFDLTFAAEAWYSGSLANEGIFLRSTGAPNLAFGDPDTSTMAQVTLVPDTAEAAVEQQPESAPPAPFTPSNDNSSSPSFESAPASSGNIFAPPASTTPEVAAEQPAPEVVEVPSQPVAAPAVPLGDATSPWWIWLLVPVFLAGMYLTAQSLTTEVVLAAEREGAMSRLIASNRSS